MSTCGAECSRILVTHYPIHGRGTALGGIPCCTAENSNGNARCVLCASFVTVRSIFTSLVPSGDRSTVPEPDRYAARLALTTVLVSGTVTRNYRRANPCRTASKLNHKLCAPSSDFAETSPWVGMVISGQARGVLRPPTARSTSHMYMYMLYASLSAWRVGCGRSTRVRAASCALTRAVTTDVTHCDFQGERTKAWRRAAWAATRHQCSI